MGGQGDSTPQRGVAYKVRKLQLTNGGYERTRDGGAYWGLGLPVYRCTAPDGSRFHLRAANRTNALLVVKELTSC